MRVMFAVGEEVRRNTNHLFQRQKEREIERDRVSERKRASTRFKIRVCHTLYTSKFVYFPKIYAFVSGFMEMVQACI